MPFIYHWLEKSFTISSASHLCPGDEMEKILKRLLEQNLKTATWALLLNWTFFFLKEKCAQLHSRSVNTCEWFSRESLYRGVIQLELRCEWWWARHFGPGMVAIGTISVQMPPSATSSSSRSSWVQEHPRLCTGSVRGSVTLSSRLYASNCNQSMPFHS